MTESSVLCIVHESVRSQLRSALMVPIINYRCNRQSEKRHLPQRKSVTKPCRHRSMSLSEPRAPVLSLNGREKGDQEIQETLQRRTLVVKAEEIKSFHSINGRMRRTTKPVVNDLPRHLPLFEEFCYNGDG